MAGSNRQNSQFSQQTAMNQHGGQHDTRLTAQTPLMSMNHGHMHHSPNTRTINPDDMSLNKTPNALNKSVQIAGGPGGLPSYKSTTQKKSLQLDGGKDQ